MENLEYSASEIRRILQQLFPQRKLVLSQLTFFNQVGVSRPTGETFRRGRRCYRLTDILPIACVLALKEQGISLKSIAAVPKLIQEKAGEILSHGPAYRLLGFGQSIEFITHGKTSEVVLQEFLESSSEPKVLFWSYDVGLLAQQLKEVVLAESEGLLKAA